MQKLRKKQRKAFMQLLAEQESITTSTTWREADAILTKKDKLWKSLADSPSYQQLDPSDRADFFADFVEELKNQEAEARKAKERKRRAKFRELLEEIPPEKIFKAGSISSSLSTAQKWAKLR
jgi:hypothetical protein